MALVKQAVRFLVQNGPVTEEDRWESVSGYSPYTMATQVAAILAAADFADANNEPGISEFLVSTADAWNEQIDELTYVEGTQTAVRCGVAGYYFRIAPLERLYRLPRCLNLQLS